VIFDAPDIRPRWIAVVEMVGIAATAISAVVCAWLAVEEAKISRDEARANTPKKDDQ